jgi:arginine utilization protein RocB
MYPHASIDWYPIVKRYTARLVHIRSVSPGKGEIQVAREVLRLLQEDGLESSYTSIGLDPLIDDPAGRSNAYAFLRGKHPQTIVLLGHIDTVATSDYGALEPFALDPGALAAHIDQLAALAPGLAQDLAAHPGDWMLGRGSADMKSGVAVNIAVMRRLAVLARENRLELSVILLATPDEENESAGVLQAVQFLLRLREQYRLQYLGAINTDYVTALYPGDPHRYIYTGTVGKLLPTFLVIGQPSHVGDPFDGLDSNLLASELIRDLSMNDELCDYVRGQSTPPPVTLKLTDLKTSYDVQLPFASYFYLNVLTFSTTPAQLLDKLVHRAQSVMEQVLRRVDETERRWNSNRPPVYQGRSPRQRTGEVFTYARLYQDLKQRLSEQRMDAEIAAAWESLPAGLDSRGRCLHLVLHLWSLSARRGPAIVVYYSPPFIPHVAAAPSLLHEAVHAVAAAHPELHLEVHEYFPLISDMSYLRLDPDIDPAALIANLPIWNDAPIPAASTHPGSYRLPLETIRQLNLPVVNLGPYGKGAHQPGERVLMSYSFGELPQLLYEVIEHLARETKETNKEHA